MARRRRPEPDEGFQSEVLRGPKALHAMLAALARRLQDSEDYYERLRGEWFGELLAKDEPIYIAREELSELVDDLPDAPWFCVTADGAIESRGRVSPRERSRYLVLETPGDE